MRRQILLLGEALKYSHDDPFEVIWGKYKYYDIDIHDNYIDCKELNKKTNAIKNIRYPITKEDNKYLVNCYSKYLLNIS